MKPYHLLISLGFIALAALAIGVYQASSAPLPAGFPTPTPNGRIEVKNYPAYRAATYRYRGQLSEAANRSFYTHYQHLSSNDISMTAPVETRYPDSTRTGATSGEAEVSFLYRDTDTYPKEVADNIRIEDVPPMTVVSLGLQGGYDFDSYQQGLTRLNEWLAEHPSYRAIGSPRRFFYDGPYVPDPLKRSEIEIPVEAVSSNR
jgi:DNA gyrase inhibitor GyrI